MSRRKAGTTNIALDIEELNMLREGLDRDRMLTTDPAATAALIKLDNRLSKALDRCVRNSGGPPAPHWSEPYEEVS